MASGLPVLVGAELLVLVGAGTDGRTVHRTWLPSTFSTSAESARSAVRLATVGRISSIRWAIHCWSTRVAGMCTAWTLVLTPNIQTAGCTSSLAMSEPICRTIRHRTLTLSRGPEPLGGQYLFSKRDPSVPGRYKLEFRLSPKLGWCTLDAARTTVDAHFVMGFRFVVSHSIAPSVSRSTGWQLCSKCQAGTHFSGFQGVCWYGGGHVPVDSTDYGFEIGDFDDVQNQSHFHRCVKCQSLFWSAPSDPNTGFCPDGGNHDSDGLELRVPHTSVERTPMRQPDWRFCMKCFTLFFQWPPEKTRCPKDQGQHKPAGFNFQIPVIVGSVAGTEPYWLNVEEVPLDVLRGRSESMSTRRRSSRRRRVEIPAVIRTPGNT